MPIYEYRCAKCGVFDVMQKITERPLRKCPTCKEKVVKLISNTAFQLKGTGWYVTDYAKKGASTGKSEAESAAKPEASSGSGEAAGTASTAQDSKPKKSKSASAKTSSDAA